MKRETIILDTWFEKVKISFRKINEPVGGVRNTIPSYSTENASHRVVEQFRWLVTGFCASIMCSQHRIKFSISWLFASELYNK
jgi:hypothetical protein